MKNVSKSSRFVIFSLVQSSARQACLSLFAVAFLTCAAAGIDPHLVAQAQRSDVPSRVSSVAAQATDNGTVVSIVVDGPSSRAQSWQDSEGYHLVLPNTVSIDSLKTARGVKVRRVGTSLEVLLQTKPGSKVTAQAEGNRIHLLIDKTLEARGDGDSAKESRLPEQQILENSISSPWQIESASPKFSSPVDDLGSKSVAPSTGNADNTHTTPPLTPILPLPNETSAQTSSSPQPSAEITVQDGEGSALASIFSATGVVVVIGLGLFGLLVSRKLRSRQTSESTTQVVGTEDSEWVDDQTVEGKLRVQPEETGLVKSGGGSSLTGGTSRQIARPTVAGPTSLFGAYRIDQEVGKLVVGQPHRMDVLASRAIDDRRAIETSLIKGLNTADLDESARRRAREALEEYGFVARQCATLLLAPDAFERTSAARSLGEIKSEAALPFLLESLYDSESIVRNQAVVSIGELKIPSAIGALLDIARTHPDVPSALLSRTLSACSVEGLDFFDAVVAEPAQLASGHDLSIVEQITHLEPLTSVEELPENSDDQDFTRALELLSSDDVQERAEALKTLSQFRVQGAVNALISVARHDTEPNLRAIAIASLGAIDHESVFPAILIGMADESREVRAGSARSLNRLNFDRVDAYVRVIETEDEDTVRDVAKACIQSGIVSQNLERLASCDHRQAYETFAIVCLLTKAGMNEPILDAIANHPNLELRLNAVHLLSCTGHPDAFESLRQLAVRDGVSEEVKTALLEGMYRLDQQAKRNEKETVEASEADSEPHFETCAVETVAEQSEDALAFAFEPTSFPEVLPEFDTNVGPELDELER